MQSTLDRLLALLHGPEQIADLPVPVGESPGAVSIGMPSAVIRTGSGQANFQSSNWCASIQWMSSRGPCGSSRFQSAPLAEARGDLVERGLFHLGMSRFNPLPLPKQGEMERPIDSSVLLVSVFKVSIRSPCRSKGR